VLVLACFGLVYLVIAGLILPKQEGLARPRRPHFDDDPAASGIGFRRHVGNFSPIHPN
jgi:hypothetical protein